MRFLFYEGLEVGEHREAVTRVREAIERDDLKSPKVHKLNFGSLYAAKLGYAKRLILQFVKHRGETACVALEIMETHEYERTRFYRGARFDVTKIDDEDDSVGGLEAGEVETSAIGYLHPTRNTVAFLEKPLSFDDAQVAVLETPCPLLLVGSAGSGKTILALEKMRSLAGDVAYVTRSHALSVRARELYFANDFVVEGQRAELCSYNEILASIAQPPGEPMSHARFVKWFARHREATRFTDAHRAWEEIRGVLTARPDGTLDRAGYLALGPRQSIFIHDDRVRLYDLFEKYLAFLEEEGLYDPNLVAREHAKVARPRFDFIVVDEVQDLTPVELTLLLRLTRRRGQFVVAGDANQIVHPSFFSWSALKTLLLQDAELAERQTLTMLDVNYRNAVAITALANEVLKVKHARFGSIDRESNMLVRSNSNDDGAVVPITSTPAATAELDEKTRRSVHHAVIVLRDEDKEEAKKRFHTPLLFSVREAKGLEYENVILFDLISRARAEFGEVAEGVSRDDLASTELAFRRARDKEDKSLERYKFFVNALYVAITRATKRVYFVESDVAHPLLALLGVAFGEAAAPRLEKVESETAAWQQEARRLEERGVRDQAAAIKANVLRQKDVPWDVLDADGYRALSAKAFAPNSVAANAKKKLYEYGCIHGDRALAGRLVKAGFAPAARFDVEANGVFERMIAPYESKNLKKVLGEVETYGVDFRSPMNLTPLMLAARAGNVALVEALLDRGARADLCDQYGLTPALGALVRAYNDAKFAEGPFGALWDRLAPAVADVLYAGRLQKIGRHEIEHFFVHAARALYRLSYSRGAPAITIAMLTGWRFPQFPLSVVPRAWRRPAEIAAMFARNDASIESETGYRLWLKFGAEGWVFAPDVELAVPSADRGDEPEFRSVTRTMGLDLMEDKSWATALPAARPRMTTSPAPSPPQRRPTSQAGPRVMALDPSLLANARRGKTRLETVDTTEGALVLDGGSVSGGEAHDIVCGKCDGVLAKGCTPTHFPVSAGGGGKIVIVCGACRAKNRLR